MIQQYLEPRTDLERNIAADESYIKGLFWGKPRYGHPEGKVIFHIREVLDNVDKIPNLDPVYKEKLRVITLTHDTFKYKEQELRKIYGRREDNHHALLAANFLARFIEDEELVRIVHLHDEAYYCWKLLRFHQVDAYKKKLKKLLDVLGDNLQLYYLFFKCDTQTGDKNQDSLRWFERTIKGIDVVDF